MICPGNPEPGLAVPLLSLAFLPYEAYISLDAILRSCWRMVVSHRNLLEWTTHQEAGRTGNPSITETYLDYVAGTGNRGSITPWNGS